MQTLEIKKDAAQTAYDNAKNSGKQLLEDLFGKSTFIKDIRDRIKTLKDVFELNNTTEDAFNEKWKNHAPHSKGADLEILIVAAYNQGKLPDWEDGTPKYYPRFKMGSSSGARFSYGGCGGWFTGSVVGSRLVFIGDNAYDNMMDAVNKFLPQYKDSKTL